MGRRGPKPKPTALKRAEGNRGKRPLNDAEPQPATLAAVPPAPDWLLPLAQERWHEVAPQLHGLAILTEVDLPALAAYCQAWAHWRDCEKWIAENGRVATFRNDKGEVTHTQPAPQVSLAKSYLDQLKKWGALFGLSPADRAGLKVEKKPAGGLAAGARKR